MSNHDDFNRRFAAHQAEFDAFDKTFKRATRTFGVVWAIGVLISLTIVGVLLWAVIRVVQHFT